MINIQNGLTATQTYKDQLNDLMQEVFGFSFAPWHERGFWGSDYESFSIIEGDRMLANASVYHMELLINSVRMDAMQIGAVATRESCRNRGLSRKLMDEIFTLYPKKPAFLFANDSVLHFYPKFGFEPVDEEQPFLTIKPNKGKGMRKLSLEDPAVDTNLKDSRQFSQILDCINTYAVHWFHIMNGYSDCLYEIPELKTLVIAHEEGSTLAIEQVFSPAQVTMDQIISYLDFEGVEEIAFGFNPDCLRVQYQTRPLKLEDSTFFVKGIKLPDKPSIMPFLIRT